MFLQDRVNPSYYSTFVGDTVTFLCLSSSRVTWKFGSEALPNNAETIENMDENSYYLKIKCVKYINAGVYTCYGLKSPNLLFISYGMLAVNSKFGDFIVTD